MKVAQANMHPGTDIQPRKPHPEATSLEEVCIFKNKGLVIGSAELFARPTSIFYIYIYILLI